MGEHDLPRVEISKAFLDALPDGILAVDANGIIRLVSAELASLSGYAGEDLVGKPVETLIPTRYHPVHSDHRAGYAAAGHPARTMGHRLNIVLLAKNGTEIPVDIGLSPLQTKDGTLVIGAVRDARERVAREAELRDTREVYETLINGVADYAIYRIDTAGKVASWNAGAERIKGYAADEIVGRSFGLFFVDEDVRAGRPEEILRIAAETGHFQEQGWRVTKEGTRFWADVAVTALRDEAGVLRGFSKVTRDITDSKRTQDRLQVLREELARMAILEDRERIGREIHDGVIQSLFGVGMSLQATALAADRPEVSDRIEKAVTEIDNAIRDLRNYIFELRPGLLADRQLDQAIRRLAHDVSEESGLTVVAEVDPRTAARLASSAGDVVQMVREALSNAARHAGPGTCRVSLSEADGWALLEIDDHGKRFDDGQPKSAGQGLANLRDRSTALGGSMEVETTPGEGTAIRIRLPL